MHNQPEPMSSARTQASRALAVWLLNNFWCDDCRGEHIFLTAKACWVPRGACTAAVASGPSLVRLD